jgi:hypothetical protein
MEWLGLLLPEFENSIKFDRVNYQMMVTGAIRPDLPKANLLNVFMT